MSYISAITIFFVIFTNVFDINCGCCCKKAGNKVNNEINNKRTIPKPNKIRVEITKNEDENYTIKIDNTNIIGTVIDTNIYQNIIYEPFKDNTKVIELNELDFIRINNVLEKLEINTTTLDDKYIIAIVQNDKINEPGSKYYIVICLDGNYHYKDTKGNGGLFSESNNKVIKYLGNGQGITNLSELMYNCKYLEICDVSKLDTRNVRNSISMCDNCSKLKEIMLSNFSAKNISFMFRDCQELENLDLSGLGKTEKIEGLFQNCHKLKNLNLLGLETSVEATNIKYIFQSCNNLKCVKINKTNNKEICSQLEKKGFIYDGNETYLKP